MCVLVQDLRQAYSSERSQDFDADLRAGFGGHASPRSH